MRERTKNERLKNGTDAKPCLSDVYKSGTRARRRQVDAALCGRSMVEMLGVLAIIGVLSVGAISGYSKAMMKYKLNKQAEAMNILLNNAMQLRPPMPNEGDAFYSELLSKLNLLPDGILLFSDVKYMKDMFDNAIWFYAQYPKTYGLGYEFSKYGDRKESQQPLDHTGCGCRVIYNLPYSRQYPAAGDSALTDGIRGGWTYGDNRWQGTMRDMDVTIDLGSQRPINYIGATFLQSVGAWVYMPRRVDFYTSDDGENFTLVGSALCDVPDTSAEIRYKVYYTIYHTSARYVRLRATKYPKAGSWLFTDEIVIN